MVVLNLNGKDLGLRLISGNLGLNDGERGLITRSGRTRD
jgi:hypothetical protein